jgi:hypothetical protein
MKMNELILNKLTLIEFDMGVQGTQQPPSAVRIVLTDGRKSLAFNCSNSGTKWEAELCVPETVFIKPSVAFTIEVQMGTQVFPAYKKQVTLVAPAPQEVPAGVPDGIDPIDALASAIEDQLADNIDAGIDDHLASTEIVPSPMPPKKVKITRLKDLPVPKVIDLTVKEYIAPKNVFKDTLTTEALKEEIAPVSPVIPHQPTKDAVKRTPKPQKIMETKVPFSVKKIKIVYL